METLFLVVVLGTPAALCALAVLGAHFHKGGNATLLDWQPTRSAETEARLESNEVEQMLGAVNRYRRQRGLPARTINEVAQMRRDFEEHGAVD